MNINVLVLTGEGINCEVETANAFNLAGADCKVVHVEDFLEQENLDNIDIIAFPGGFSYGDEIRSGKILAEQIAYGQRENLIKFIEQDKKPVLGICNGFQILMQLDIFKGQNQRKLTLAENTSEQFLNDWVRLSVKSSHCIWLKDLKELFMPIRNREGLLSGELDIQEQVALCYQDPYNGEKHNIAGLTNLHGNVLGMMPHPEAAQYPFLFPKDEELFQQNRTIFKNAIEYSRRLKNA